MKDKKNIPAEVSRYMAELGKKGGARNKAKGSAYFKWVRSHVKNNKKGGNDGDSSPTDD